MTAPQLSHADLVKVAEQWLWGGDRSCKVVLREYISNGNEIPDAIGFWAGWRYGRSILVECKATRADFRADRQKVWRQVTPESAMGAHRYYLVPKGLVDPSEVPGPWGLLETPRQRVRVVKPARRLDLDATALAAEARMLTTALNRLVQRGHLPAIYVNPYAQSTGWEGKGYGSAGYRLWDEAWSAVKRGPAAFAEWLESLTEGGDTCEG